MLVTKCLTPVDWASSVGVLRTCVVCIYLRSQVEVKLEGEGPWPLPDGSNDMQIVLTPGHTEHHCCLVYEAQKVNRLCYPSRCMPIPVCIWQKATEMKELPLAI